MNKKWIALALKILVSGGLIWLLLGTIDLTTAWERILAADGYFLSAAVGTLVLQIVIIVSRWQAVLRAMDIHVPFVRSLEIMYIGQFFNQALPSSIGGDAVRIYKTYKQGIPLISSINSVMLDRVATVLGLVALVVIAAPFFMERVGQEDALWIIPAVSIVAGGGVAGLALLMVLDKVPSRFRRYKVIHGLAVLAADTRTVFLSPTNVFKVMFVSLVGHANIALATFLIAQSLGLIVTWVDCMVLMPPVLLLMTLPISIAGWGVREGAMVTAFALIGIPADGALVLSIMLGLIAILVSLPGGLVWLMSGDRDIGNINLKAKT